MFGFSQQSNLLRNRQVFSSYILQCVFVAFLFFAFLLYGKPRRAAFSPAIRKKPKEGQSGEVAQPAFHLSRHQKALVDLLENFHQIQCYFSGTLQIAALGWGIFKKDMLATFMFIPLATNGVLPVTFSYLLLNRYAGPRLDHALLTFTCWLLSSIVYWALYSNLMLIDSDIDNYRTFEQWLYKMSAIPACGGYSALAACPRKTTLGGDVVKASNKLIYLTPIIWSFSTLILFILIGIYVTRWSRAWKEVTKKGSVTSKTMVEKREASPTTAGQENSPMLPTPSIQSDSSKTSHPILSRPYARIDALFWLACLGFLAGIGMQMSLLNISSSLKMMDVTNWSFGQVVAVTIWVPPLLSWIYAEVKGMF